MAFIKIVSSVICIVALVSCANKKIDDADSQKFLHTRSSIQMQGMASSLRNILRLFSDSQNKNPVDIRNVILELDKLNAFAVSARTDFSERNLSSNFDEFIEDIAQAKELASKQEPEIEPSAKLVNACLACHDSL